MPVMSRFSLKTHSALVPRATGYYSGCSCYGALFEYRLVDYSQAKIIPNPTIKVAPKHEQLTTEFFVAV